MAAPTMDHTWEQGEDFSMSMVYEEGLSESTTNPVNLSGWSVRMDIKTPAGLRLFTFNSQALADVDPATSGDQPDPATEATLGTGGQITINVSRNLTLPPSGPIYQQLNSTTPVNIFDYDIFLRNTAGLQTKILKGKITVNRSVTLWG